MDLMDDEGLKKSVIDQMMGELDDETGKSLKKGGPVKGVEISIMVSPHPGDGAEGEESPAEAEAHGPCMDAECEDPMHDHAERDAAGASSDPDDFISQLLSKLG